MLKTFQQFVNEEIRPEEAGRLKTLGLLEPDYHLTFDWSRREGGSLEEIEADYGLVARLTGDEITLTGSRDEIEAFIEDYGVVHDGWEEATDGDFWASC